MVRGRKPKSAELKLLSGNAGKRPTNNDAPSPALTKKTKPFPWLSKRAQQVWRNAVPELVHTGQLTEVDVEAFAGYCSACATVQECEEFINKNGMTYESYSDTIRVNGKVVKIGLTIKRRQEVIIRSDALKILRSFASEFGLTPSSRTRIKIDKKPEKSDLEKLRDKRPSDRAG